MQFNLGSAVYDRAGRHTGSVARVVMDQHGAVQDIVVELNRLLPRAVLIPLDGIASVDAKGVHLRLDHAGLDALLDFVETDYAVPSETTPEVIEPAGGIMFPFGIEPGVGPMIIGERMRLPEGTTDIARGYLVRCSDGAEAGTIQDIIMDESGAVDHLTITEDQEDNYPVRVRPSLIASVEDEIVTLTVTAEELRAPLGRPAAQ